MAPYMFRNVANISSEKAESKRIKHWYWHTVYRPKDMADFIEYRGVSPLEGKFPSNPRK